MIEYIKDAIADLRQCLHQDDFTYGLKSRFDVLVEEINKIEPRDFEPSHRHRFMDSRRRLQHYATLRDHEDWLHLRASAAKGSQTGGASPYTTKLLRTVERTDLLRQSASEMIAAGEIIRDAGKLLDDLRDTLDHYAGPDALASRIQFPFVKDPTLRQIVERDYRDLTLRLFPTQAWKSVVILAGSILEAVLHDLLTRPANVASAMAALSAPKYKATVKAITAGDWSLANYIDVADELSLLPRGWKDTIHSVLRDYRNFVHPRLEAQAGLIGEGDAYQSVGSLMKTCDHIRVNHP